MSAQPKRHRRHDSSPRITGRALQKRRLSVWTKDPTCALCGRLTDYPSGFELDHRIPLFKDGEDTEANCQVLCNGVNGCHEKKTAADLGYRHKQTIGLDGYPINA